MIVIEKALIAVPGAELGDADKVTIANAKPPGTRTFPLVQDPLLQMEKELEIESPFESVAGFVLKWSMSFTVPTFSKQMYCV